MCKLLEKNSDTQYFNKWIITTFMLFAVIVVLVKLQLTAAIKGLALDI